MKFNRKPVSTFTDTLNTTWVPNTSTLYFNNARKLSTITTVFARVISAPTYFVQPNF